MADFHIASSEEGPFDILNLIEIEARAAKRLPLGAFDFIARGAGEEWTLRENRSAFDRREILPRVYAGVGESDTSTNLLGAKLQSPFVAAPTMGHGLVHTSAEIGTVEGSDRAGALFVLSTLSNRTIEEVARASSAPRWFQFYQQVDDGVNRALLQRAAAAGYTAIVHTVDVTAGGNREANIRNKFVWPSSLPLADFAEFGGVLNPKAGLNWADLELVQKLSGLPVIPKGILHPAGCHPGSEIGRGRTLDIESWWPPARWNAVGIDGPAANCRSTRQRCSVDHRWGVRRGQDVFKALALGASAVAIGRPILYGLALAGADGVAAVFEQLTKELKNVMHLAGIATLKDITSAALL